MPFVEKKLDGFLTAENADPPASPCPSASAEVSRPARLALPVRHRLRLQAIAGRARMAGRHAHLRGLVTPIRKTSGLDCLSLDPG